MKISRKDLGIELPKEPPKVEPKVEIREVKVPSVDQAAIISAVNTLVSSKFDEVSSSVDSVMSDVNVTLQTIMDVVNKEKPKREFVLKVKRGQDGYIESVKALEL